MLRYLQGLHWNYEQTHQYVNDHSKWFLETHPIDPKPFEAFLNMGIFYGYKRDKGSRPVLVLNVERMVTSGIDLEIIMNMVNYFLNFVITKCMIPSRIENSTVIVDMNNVGITQIPKTLLQGVVTQMQRNYRGRMFRMYLLNMHWLLRGLWSLISKMVDEFTLQKMQLLGYDFKTELLKVIPEDHLE